MNYEIEPLDKYSFNDAIKLLQLYYKEYEDSLLNRIEAEMILKDKENITYTLIVENEVKGLYIYRDNGSVYSVVSFVLHPTVRQKKVGYMLWKHINEKLENKPAIIGVVRTNSHINSIVKKRGHYIGSGLDNEDHTIDYYNLTFKG
jgi:hypothetical protein